MHPFDPSLALTLLDMGVQRRGGPRIHLGISDTQLTDLVFINALYVFKCRQPPGTNSRLPVRASGRNFHSNISSNRHLKRSQRRFEELQSHRKRDTTKMAPIPRPGRSHLPYNLPCLLQLHKGLTLRDTHKPPPVVEASLAVTFSEIGVRKSMYANGSQSNKTQDLMLYLPALGSPV